MVTKKKEEERRKAPQSEQKFIDPLTGQITKDPSSFTNPQRFKKFEAGPKTFHISGVEGPVSKAVAGAVAGREGTKRALRPEEQAQVGQHKQFIKELEEKRAQELATLQARREDIAERAVREEKGQKLEEEVIKDPQRFGFDLPLVDTSEIQIMGLQERAPERVPFEELTPKEKALSMAALGGPLTPVAATGESTPVLFSVAESAGAFTALRAVQLGNMARIANKLKPAFAIIKRNWLGVAATYLTIKEIGDFLNRKVPETQQAINTFGQMTSTIAGSAIKPAGDTFKGLQMLNEIEQAILVAEQGIQSGKIQNATLKWNGKIIDIDADVQDQLSQVRDSKIIIQSFLLRGEFGEELSDQDIQAHLRKLRREGIIKPVEYREPVILT